MTIIKLQTMRRLLLSLLAVIESELRERGVSIKERSQTISTSDYQQR